MLHFSRFKTIVILGVCFLGALLAWPNLVSKDTLKSFPSWIPTSQITLGLDLQGGGHMLIQVEMEKVVEARLETLKDELRLVLRPRGGGEARPLKFRGLKANSEKISVTIPAPEDVDEALTRARGLIGVVTGGFLGTGSGPDIEVLRDGNRIEIKLTEEERIARASSTVDQAIEVLGRRINALGLLEPVIQRQGQDRIIVQVPGASAAEIVNIKKIIETTAQMSFHLVDLTITAEDVAAGRVPPSLMVVESGDNYQPFYVVEKRAIVSGENLVDAYPGRDQNGEPAVNFRFDASGGKKFADLTSANVGRLFAINLDDKIISAPRIRTPILGGAGVITGNFTIQSAADLSLLLRAGSLPAALSIIEERSVGPDLGADSVAAGKLAAMVGFIGVILFMAFYYRRFGLYADIALIMNMIMIVGVLSLLGATLTLPGIAGIVLTIGMAVDANVLIFERIREELDSGKTPVNAIEAGYKRAFTTIIDANITTFIAAAILFQLGTGPIRGFAVTLAIGILTSMFTAIMLSRLIIALWVKKSRPSELPLSSGFRMFKETPKFGFIKLGSKALIVSLVLMVVSVGLVVTKGLNQGIDFKGGMMIEAGFSKDADLPRLRKTIGALNLGDVAIQTFGEATDVLIRVEQQPGGDKAQQVFVEKMKTALSTEFGDDISYRRVEVVGPKVGGELIQSSAIAVFASILAMLVYIWFRFDTQFGIGGVIALIHDAVLTLGIFSLMQIEFNLSIIAALLTIAGYSINDTVVVYDRIRENLRKYKKMEISELINQSVNETLSRTVITSLTTLVALGALFLFGGEVIRSFIFAMMFGVVIGTYSSIFVAAPILLKLGVRRDWSGVGQSTAKGVT